MKEEKFDKKKKFLIIAVDDEEDLYCESVDTFRCFFSEYCPLWLGCNARLLYNLKMKKREYKARKVFILFHKNEKRYVLAWEKTPHLPVLKEIKKGGSIE